MLGRSDGTLNPAGVRFGSADLYAILSGADFRDTVVDSLAVGVRRECDTDERVALFLQLADSGMELPDELVARIKSAVRSKLSPRHIPALILVAPQIPVMSKPYGSLYTNHLLQCSTR